MAGNKNNAQEIRINADDLIKLAHFDILDNLIKISADEVIDTKEFTLDDIAEIVAKNYTKLFKQEFLNRAESKYPIAGVTFNSD